MILWETTDKLEKLERGRDHLSTIKVRKGGKGKWEVVSLNLLFSSYLLFFCERKYVASFILIFERT